jgi:pimeloyl-ACP methyl ester carboxylesterase
VPSESLHELAIKIKGATLGGEAGLVASASGLVVFAHGSGSSRHSPRNQYVAAILRDHGLATLLFDLLTEREESIDDRSGELRFNIPFLAGRLVEVTDWLDTQDWAGGLDLGYFGASTGAGAALIAASERPDRVRAVVSRGGRPDLAMEAIPRVRAATLLIVGGRDIPVIGMNETAFARLCEPKRLEIVPGATHLFEEPGALERVSALAAGWFRRYLGAPQTAST